MKERILFVTKMNEDYDEGFPYVTELSKTLDAGINILMIYDSPVMEILEVEMTAVAFAEAGEFETAGEILCESGHTIEEWKGDTGRCEDKGKEVIATPVKL